MSHYATKTNDELMTVVFSMVGRKQLGLLKDSGINCFRMIWAVISERTLIEQHRDACNTTVTREHRAIMRQALEAIAPTWGCEEPIVDWIGCK